jgi:hypothetical protein
VTTQEVGTTRALIVSESLFGNTAVVARAVADGVRDAWPGADVGCRPVGEADGVREDSDLLVLGAPTHFWGLTRATTRAMELQYEKRVAPRLKVPAGSARSARPTGPIRALLAELPEGRGGAAAAFDTRMSGSLTGGARRELAERIRRAGYRLVAPPETFVVESVPGPLRAGEAERARAWGATLARAVPQNHIMNRRHSMKIIEDTVGRVDATLPRTDPAAGDVPTHSRSLDLTRVVTTAELVVGAVVVARYLSRRPGAAKAFVTMGPGGWVSMKGGTVALRRGSRPWGRPRPVQPVATGGRAPLWARVLSAVPLQSLIR